ncbi:MAG: response regulator transcription factor [Firmicutes bacterium]|nr:response regulator transcription factor [Bacillota bacterium]
MGVRILVVEDDAGLARFVELELQHEGYEVTCCDDGRKALQTALDKDFELILLDIMLPGLNGLEVLRRLQHEKSTPVILLTARDAIMDKVAGLDAGAVDYITKPFAIEELLARIRVILKLYGRKNTVVEKVQDEDQLVWGDLTLSVKKHEVRFNGEEIELKNREFLMLKTLLENMDIVLSRETLLEKVCGYNYVGETNIVDVYVRYLRQKIDETYGVKMIHTIRGVGYVIKKGEA